MQLVQYSGSDPFVIDDEVTEALLDYAFELAARGRHDLVRLAARDAGSSRITVSLLLGPGSTLSARTLNMLDPVGDELAAPELRRRILHLHDLREDDAEPGVTG